MNADLQVQHAPPRAAAMATTAPSATAGGDALSALSQAAQRANAGPHASSLAQLQAVVAQRACADCGTVRRTMGGGAPVQRADDDGALPRELRARLEHLSGRDLSGVRVNYGSPGPAGPDALAMLPGPVIARAPGQEAHRRPRREKHLPHEGWHVKQRRARPPMDPDGTPVNDDATLEREADVMGARALAAGRAAQLQVTEGPGAGRQGGGAGGVAQRMNKRPAFTADSRQSAINWHNTRPDCPFKIDEKTPDLPSHNAAMPHRMAWKDIRESTKRFQNGEEDASDFVRWTDRFIAAGEERIRIINDQIAMEGGSDELQELLARAQSSQAKFVRSRDQYVLTEDTREGKEFLRQANSFHANVPDVGPHRGVNNPVREAGHLHFQERRGPKGTRSPSPMSRQVLDMTPERLPKGLAYQDDDNLITTTGETVSLDEMSPFTRARVDLFAQKIVGSFDPGAAFGATSSGVTTTAPPRKNAKRSNGSGKKKRSSGRGRGRGKNRG